MDELNRTNTFLSRLHGDAYRYHHLFQDFLREKAAADGIDRPKLCKAAAAYYREHRDYSARCGSGWKAATTAASMPICCCSCSRTTAATSPSTPTS
ncbi:MAG: hypothetical protein ACLSVD_08405 [Eggerthellaceae bacterium]